MPYIEQRLRGDLAKPVADVICAIRACTVRTQYAGACNFAVSSILASLYLDANVGEFPSYNNINEAIGVLECAKLELYRRVGAPKEDRAARDNGDITEYAHAARSGGQLSSVVEERHTLHGLPSFAPPAAHTIQDAYAQGYAAGIETGLNTPCTCPEPAPPSGVNDDRIVTWEPADNFADISEESKDVLRGRFRYNTEAEAFTWNETRALDFQLTDTVFLPNVGTKGKCYRVCDYLTQQKLGYVTVGTFLGLFGQRYADDPRVNCMVGALVEARDGIKAQTTAPASSDPDWVNGAEVQIGLRVDPDDPAPLWADAAYVKTLNRTDEIRFEGVRHGTGIRFDVFLGDQAAPLTKVTAGVFYSLFPMPKYAGVSVGQGRRIARGYLQGLSIELRDTPPFNVKDAPTS